MPIVSHIASQQHKQQVGNGEPRRKRRRHSPPPSGDSALACDGDEEAAACQSCRKRKLRCSKQQPCSQCDRLGVECAYDERRRPGIKSGAIEALSQRLTSLEHMFLGQGLLLQSLSSHQQTAPTGTVDAGPNPGASLSDQVERLKSTLMHATMPSEGAPHERGDRLGANKMLDDWSGKQQQHQSPEDIITTEPRMPPDQLIDQLVEWYFAEVHRWIPILHVRRFRDQMRHPSSRESIHSILIAIVSLSLKFSRPAHLSNDERKTASLRCRHAVILRSMEHFSVENLQALVIIAFDTIGSGRGPSSWSIIGSMARTVEQLRLNTEDGHREEAPSEDKTYLMRRMAFLRPAQSWVEAEERRRLFWTVFMMDRFCGVATGWSNSVAVGDVRRRLPCEGAIWEAGTPVTTPFFGSSQDSSFAEQSNTPTRERMVSQQEEMDAIGGFAFCLEATETLNLVTNFFLQHAIRSEDQQDLQVWLVKFKELDLRLVKWRLFLPEKWRNASVLNQDGIMDPNLTLAHVTHNTAIIQLHQCVAFPPPALRGCSNALPTASSVTTCITAATEIGTIAKQFLQQSDGITHPQMSFCLFMAGRVLLSASCQNRESIDSAFDVISKALSDIAHRWNYLGGLEEPTQNLAARLRMRLSESRAVVMARDSTSASGESLDVTRPVYDEDLARSRAVSEGPNEATEQHQANPRGLHTAVPEIPASEQFLDPFAFSFSPMPVEMEYSGFTSSGLHRQDGRQGFDAAQPNDLEWWSNIESMFGDDFQQMPRVTMYDTSPG